MQTSREFNVVIFVVLISAIIAGAYTLLHTPAPKPLPSPQPSVPAPQPIPGAPLLNVDKYRNEPVISVWLAGQGTIRYMGLEEYLEGVVAKEMEPGWPIEALKAQAIASRTLTLQAIESGTIKKLHNTDVSTDKEELQAFAPEKVNGTVREAVKSTRGKVLLYAGSLIFAIYSSSNGQIAATKEESFPTEIPYPTPYFQPVTDNSFKYTPDNIRSWALTVPAGEVADAVGYSGNPQDITILEKGPSGRILFIGVGDKKVSGAKLRKTLGYDRLKSTLLTEMSCDGARFTFKGLGWGNGVGLCQWGAYTYAQDGYKAEDILTHYYFGAQIQKLWE